MEITFTFMDDKRNTFQRSIPFTPAFEAYNTLGWVVEHFAIAIEDSDVNRCLNTLVRTLAEKMEAVK